MATTQNNTRRIYIEMRSRDEEQEGREEGN